MIILVFSQKFIKTKFADSFFIKLKFNDNDILEADDHLKLTTNVIKYLNVE